MTTPKAAWIETPSACHLVGEVARPTDRVWVVTAPSAYRPMYTCFLGRGTTKQAAMADAFGPREAWGNATRRSMKIADVYETDEDTANELQHGSGDE